MEQKHNAAPISIRMQQGEQAGQPIYANFASTQLGQGVVIIDFGFLDPQMVAAINRLARSGEKTPDTVAAKMVCRMALSIESANNLMQQLNQMFQKK